MSEAPDDIPALLREAQARGLDAEAGELLAVYRSACGMVLEWQKNAGRALAMEGLETDVLRLGIEAWMEREREALREKLRQLLGA